MERLSIWGKRESGITTHGHIDTEENIKRQRPSLTRNVQINPWLSPSHSLTGHYCYHRMHTHTHAQTRTHKVAHSLAHSSLCVHLQTHYFFQYQTPPHVFWLHQHVDTTQAYLYPVPSLFRVTLDVTCTDKACSRCHYHSSVKETNTKLYCSQVQKCLDIDTQSRKPSLVTYSISTTVQWW